MSKVDPAKKETEAVVAYIRHKVREGDYYSYVDSNVRMSRLDGMLCQEGGLVCGVEVKWRRFNWDTLVNRHNGEMLMPADKLMAGQTLAYAFGVPTLLLCLLDDCLVVQSVVGAKGEKLNVTREIYEESNRTIEGGTIQRKNCYITTEGAERIPIGL